MVLDKHLLSMLGGITTLVLSMLLCLQGDDKQTVQAAAPGPGSSEQLWAAVDSSWQL